MRAILKWTLLGFVGLVVLVAIFGSNEDEGGNTPIATDESRTEQKQAEEPAPEPEEANPDADTETRCDYLLGEIGDAGFVDSRFVGSAKVTNTGNVSVRIRGRATWEQLGSDPITQTKEFRVREGESRTVQFKVPATQDQIGAHQSADAECKVSARIVAVLR